MRRELLGGALLLLLGASTGVAQSRRLNAPFAPDAIGEVRSFALAPGGRTIYAADQDAYRSIEFYNAPSDGSAPGFRLAAPGMSLAATISMSASPDGRWLVYRTDAFRSLFSHLAELFSVPLDGSGSALRLSGTLVDGGSVSTYAVGATRVVYLADALADETYELFSAPLDGSSGPVRISGTLVAGTDVESFALSPDGTRVVYRANFELFGVPADGSAPPVRLHPQLTGGQNAQFLGEPFTPDSSRVLFVSYMGTAVARELYVVPADGSAPPLRLNPAFPSGRDVREFAVCPLSQRVVYLADQITNEVFELFSVPLDGSAAAVRLNGVLVPGANGFQISPDGQSVVFSAEELFSVPIDGSAPRVQLNGPLQHLSAPRSPVFRISKDSARVVYYANDEAVGYGPNLYSAPIGSSGASVRISGPLAADQALYGITLADDGRVLYSLDTTSCIGYPCTTAVELHSAPIDGSSAPLVLSTEGSDEEALAIDPLSGRAVFSFRQRADPLTLTSASELDSVPTDGSAAPVKLHPPLALGPSDRDVASFQYTADGHWALYLADQEQNNVRELFRVRSDGSSAPVKVNGPVSLHGGAGGFALSPDSAWVVYGYDADGSGGSLFSARIDGSLAPVPIAPPGSLGALISPDSARVVYERTSLIYSVPIDGSAGPVTLVGSFVAGGSLSILGPPLEGISPDSSRFVFVADKDTDDTFELFSVPLDGSAAPARLSGALVAGGDVLTAGNEPLFHISPDSSRVVYVADANVNGVAELFSVPLDGSAAPVRLNGPLVTGGKVSALPGGFRISPDSTRVVYVADELQNERFELFSVPLDGSAPPVRLNATLPTHGDVEDGFGSPFVISPDSTRVVYRADQFVDEHFVLLSVPLDGSAPPVPISGTMISTGDVDFRPFAITSDGTRVVYMADAQNDEVPELFAAPIDGAPPTRLGIPAGFGDFELCPDGSALVFRTGAFPRGIAQLYLVPLDGTLARGASFLQGRSDASAYTINPDSGSVVYIADRKDSVDELWLTVFADLPRVSARKP